MTAAGQAGLKHRTVSPKSGRVDWGAFTLRPRHDVDGCRVSSVELVHVPLHPADWERYVAPSTPEPLSEPPEVAHAPEPTCCRHVAWNNHGT